MVSLALGTPRMYLFFVFLVSKCSSSLGRSYLQTNEVVERPEDQSVGLCTNNSICGYLQANTHGINQQASCSCGLGSRCPMTWDSADGHSVSQGSDQYKFCGKPPALSVCQDLFTAYTSRVVFSKETEEVLMKSDHIHCVCPDTHNHVLSNQKFEDPDELSEAMELTYVCAPLETCGVGDYCKTVSETPTEFLVNRKCACPTGLRCPTDATSGIRTTPMGRGLVHLIRCQL